MTDSHLTVTTPATDLTLLSIEELREAADVADKTQDGELRRFGLMVAGRITAHCRVRRDGANPPTLKQETVTETIRLQHNHHHFHGSRHGRRLILARRPVSSVLALTINDQQQDVSTLEIDRAAGIIHLSALYGFCLIVVSYVAGLATVPDDLKLAARQLLQQYIDADRNETKLLQENVPGVLERRWQVTAKAEADVPQSIADMLAPYRNED